MLYYVLLLDDIVLVEVLLIIDGVDRIVRDSNGKIVLNLFKEWLSKNKEWVSFWLLVSRVGKNLFKWFLKLVGLSWGFQPV